MKRVRIEEIYRRPLAIVSRTMYGWPLGKSFVRGRNLVGRGHVYGVCDAADRLRALMKPAGGRIPINGSRSWGQDP